MVSVAPVFTVSSMGGEAGAAAPMESMTYAFTHGEFSTPPSICPFVYPYVHPPGLSPAKGGLSQAQEA